VRAVAESIVTALPSPLLEGRGLGKTYARVTVLNGVSFTLAPAEILALVGENGAGKSTLIKILSGAIQADPGSEVLIDGRPVTLHAPEDADRNGIVTVYQEFSLFPDLSITENLFFGEFVRTSRPISWGHLHGRAEELLASMDVHLPVRRRVSSLSVADRQMVEIAKALHRRARVMILDEPTAVLGGRDVDRLLEMVRQLKARGVAVIFVSHRLNEIFGLADSYLVLRDGQQVARGAIAQTNADELVRNMVGRQIAKTGGREDIPSGDAELLRVDGLTRAGVLHDVSFTVHSGEVVGIAGLRGAGRTELVRAIFGADRIDAGRIYVGGQEKRICAPHAAIGAGLGLVPEDRGTQGLFKNLSALQNMFMASTRGRVIDHRSEKRRARSHVERLKIRLPGLSTLVGRLSGGNQQKVVLAKWLEAGVRVLLLDEPTRGIDVASKAQIYSLVRELCRNGVGIVLISSELPEVLENSDRVLVMHRGTIAVELPHALATEEAVISYAVGAGT
jgi:ABC-type sugar transport system ATPase subunit